MVLAVVLIVEAIGVAAMLYNMVPQLQQTWFVTAAVFCITCFSVMVIPQLAYVWLKPIITYDRIKHDAIARKTFFHMAAVVIPAIAVVMYLVPFRKSGEIQHLPIFAQVGVFYSILQLAIKVYKHLGRMLLIIAHKHSDIARRRTGLTPQLNPLRRPTTAQEMTPLALPRPHQQGATAPQMGVFRSV